MDFLAQIFAQLEGVGEKTVLRELLPEPQKPRQISGHGLLQKISQARSVLAEKKLNQGDRCALLAVNSIDWVAMDLAIMAEGLVVVPLYARQAPAELVAIMKDCSPSLICCGDLELRDSITQHWPQAPPQCIFDEITNKKNSGSRAAEAPLSGAESEARAKASLAHAQGRSASHKESDPVAIIYTSGTSGEAKGVVLNARNVGHMLGCTAGRLDLLMQGRTREDRVFHYLPFCFAASWIMLLTCLERGSLLTLNTDLNRLAKDMRAAAPDYFLNVPALLERMRRAVDEQLWKTGGLALMIYSRAKGAWMRKQQGKAALSEGLWLTAANRLVFPTIRKKMIGQNLKALICGSAPLNRETQLYFMMLGIPVLQGYGLTETTGICTLDDPRHVVPGRVGPAIPEVEMKLGENDEIIVRGPNLFSGYWNRPQETARVMGGGWFHTGDQGEVNGTGNWRISGRIKNLIILSSGHKVAPEPIEDEILTHLAGAQQVVLVGNGRGYLCALVTGKVSRQQTQSTLDEVNSELPHYKQVRAFYVQEQPFSVENGLLTANGKLRREAIASQLRNEIEEMYRVKQAV
jgi:long-chain acyl-CoA synthetase